MTWPHRRGELHGRSKFTQEQVEFIVKEYINRCQGQRRTGIVADMSREYTWMSRQNIQFICQGKAWPHVTQPLLRAAGLLDPRWALPDCADVYQRTSPFWQNMNALARERRLEARRRADHTA